MSQTVLPEGFSRVDDVLAPFRGRLGVLRSRVRRGVLLEGAGFLLPVFLGYWLLTLWLDRWLRLETPARAVLLALWAAWTVRRLLRLVVRPLRSSLVDEELALAVERASPGLGQRFISAIQFAKRLESGETRGDSPALMAAAVAALPAALAAPDMDRALRREKVRRAGSIALLASAVLAAGWAVDPSTFAIWARRNLLLSSSVEWPRFTRLSFLGVREGRLVAPRGDDLTLRVRAGGVVPEQVFLEYAFENGGSATEPMIQNTGEDVFTYTFPGLMDPVRVRAEGGDGQTPFLHVVLVDRPVPESLELLLRYPAYMAKDAHRVSEDAAELTLPRGAVLEVEARSSKRLVKAALAVGDGGGTAAELSPDGRGIRGRIEPGRSGLFKIRMLDEDGLTEGPGRQLLLRVVDDRPPKLRARVRGLGTRITPMARIPVELTVTDDFGLGGIRLDWAKGKSAAVGSGGARFEEGKAAGLEDFEAGLPAFDRKVVFDLLPMMKNSEALLDPGNPVLPGDFLAIRFEARDRKPLEGGGVGQVSRSDAYTFKVVTPSELLKELLRRQNEQRLEFAKVLKRHEEDAADFRDFRDLGDAGAQKEAISRRIRALGRHERHLARTVLTIERRYRQILDEMGNNRLAEESKLNRLRSRIVLPLEALGSRHMPALAKSLALYSRSERPEDRRKTESGYDEVARLMRLVLRHMTQLETFTRILNTLREVIRFEDQAAAEAKARLEREMEELFGKGGKKDKD